LSSSEMSSSNALLEVPEFSFLRPRGQQRIRIDHFTRIHGLCGQIIPSLIHDHCDAIVGLLHPLVAKGADFFVLGRCTRLGLSSGFLGRKQQRAFGVYFPQFCVDSDERPLQCLTVCAGLLCLDGRSRSGQRAFARISCIESVLEF
jgi:hypothetical protein